LEATAQAAGSEDRIDRGTALALIALGLAVVVIANDFSALNVALPSMERDFHTNVTTIQWVINAYALTFGVLIVTGGRLADLFGRRSAFFIATVVFAGFSALGAAAPTETWLIACRVGMGVGGAVMWPAILGMTYGAVPDSKAGLAGGLILGAAGVGNALGPLIGGVLSDLASWRWIFLLNVPVSALAMVIVAREVHRDRPEGTERRIDYAGVVTLSVGLVALLVALDQVDDWGWGDPRVITLLVAAGVLITAWIPIERRAGSHALVPRDVMRNESFAASCGAILMMSAVFFATLLYLPQFMQKVLGYSPLDAGLGLLPFLVMFAAVSFVAGPLYERLGAKPVVVTGAACIAVGPFLLSLAEHDAAFTDLVPGMVIAGIGVGLFYSAATTAGVTAVDPSRSSLAGGIIYMFQIAGGAVGLGVTTTVVTSASVFADGVQNGFRLVSALAVVGFLITLFLVGGRLGRGGAPEAPG
jgi:EmrB/QacA subfamily drug resistance transporter